MPKSNPVILPKYPVFPKSAPRKFSNGKRSAITPGPWRMARKPEAEILSESGQLIALCKCGYRLEHYANARIMAAAPDLLECLHRALDENDAMHNQGFPDAGWAKEARMAIAKATVLY